MRTAFLLLLALGLLTSAAGCHRRSLLRDSGTGYRDSECESNYR